ncbi:hypothetical protein ABK883_19330, partial [Enterobacter roggenkampii]|uniref:hypothetical protein n=1 Tax=Enterobacter roggenkampii TaxID=1812935 RepID=UPI00374FC9AF
GLTALSAEFTIGEGELMAHDVPLGCAPDEYDDLISGTCSHLPKLYLSVAIKAGFITPLRRYAFKAQRHVLGQVFGIM